MAGGNPFMPPGANPGGPVPQGPGTAGPAGGMRGAPGAPSSGGGTPDILGGNRVPMPGVRGTGASILAPPPPDQPPGQNGQQAPGANVPASKQGDPFADIHQNFKQAKFMYEQNVKAQNVLDHLRTELDDLMEKGDIVRPEDVIEAAGRLVGHGIGATQLAQIMSDMPAQGGEGLASWIRMHDVTITQAEQGLMTETAVFRNRMGIAALRSMGALHVQDKMNQLHQVAGKAMEAALGGAPGPASMGSGGGNALMGDQTAQAPEAMNGGNGSPDSGGAGAADTGGGGASV